MKYKIKNEVKTGTGNNYGFDEIENIPSKQLDMYESSYSKLDIQENSVMYGTLVSVSEKEAIVDIGSKSSVHVSLDVIEKLCIENISIGTRVPVLIVSNTDKKEFTITGSFYKFKLHTLNTNLQSFIKNKTVLTGIPTEFNHGGYTVLTNIEDETIALFMPHLVTDMNKLPDPNSIIGEEINFLVQEFTINNKTSIIASRKAYLNEMAKLEMKNIKKGELYTGHVINATDFAVFVQFNTYFTGMIHKSNLSERAKEMLSEGTIKPGTLIEFYVKDNIKGKFFLTQVLKDSLWDSIQTNDILLGTIAQIKDFGILVQLDYETKGLLHESLFKNENLSNYSIGDKIEVYVTNVNKSKRQITLGLRK